MGKNKVYQSTPSTDGAGPDLFRQKRPKMQEWHYAGGGGGGPNLFLVEVGRGFCLEGQCSSLVGRHPPPPPPTPPTYPRGGRHQCPREHFCFVLCPPPGRGAVHGVFCHRPPPPTTRPPHPTTRLPHEKKEKNIKKPQDQFFKGGRCPVLFVTVGGAPSTRSAPPRLPPPPPRPPPLTAHNTPHRSSHTTARGGTDVCFRKTLTPI